MHLQDSAFTWRHSETVEVAIQSPMPEVFGSYPTSGTTVDI